MLDRAAGASRNFIIYDEAWRTLAAPTHLARVNAELRLSRARGTSTVLITHAVSDTDKAADVGSSAAATAHGLAALTDPERAALATLGKDEALWKIGTPTTRRIHTDLGTTEAALFTADR